MPKKVLVLGKGQPTAYSLSSIYAEPAKDIGLDVQWQYKELYYPKDNKGRLAKTVKADLQKEWLQDNVSELDSADIILCTDGTYFKTLTKSTKVDTTAGQVLESNYTKTPVMFLPSVGSYSYNPDKTKEQIEFIFGKLSDWFNGTYTALGTNIIHSEEYPENILDIKVFLDSLLNQERLYVDIETFSLKLTEAGLGTISFSLDEHNGGAFAVDLHPTHPTIVREMLVDFFKQYKGHLVFHKSNFDVMVLIYELFMNKDLTDFNGMMEGMQYLCTNLDDTLVITYLATNSCAGNILGLKQLAAEYAGDWAVDVTDIRAVPLKDLLRYNLVDTLSTAYVYKKYYPRMVQDNQEELYKGLFLDTLRTNIRMQLIGLPIDLNKVSKLKKELEDELNDLETKLRNSQEIQDAEDVLAEQRTIKRNATLKKKVTTVQENHKPFLLTSNQELAVLLYEVMKLPIIEFTDTKQPSTSKKTLKKLQNHTTNQSQNDVLQWLQEYADVQKMLSAFIPAFEQADTNKFGNSYLHGWFNLCGTVSGRLSSSQPNLQNLPATGSRFAKPIKKVFCSNSEWVFVGIDFFSLEDRISAVYTKDPNKLSVYLYGYDGHCLRALAYYGHLMPELQEQLKQYEVNSKEYINIVNSIADHPEYSQFRQRSKSPTFALTYAGTYLTLMKNLGFTEEEARKVEEQYHTLYQISTLFIQAKINQAIIDGYVTGAFGLRVRTPLLGASLPNTKLSSEAAAEARTAGNALGQGWGLLNDRAMNAVMNQVDNSKWKGMVQPCAKVHDACYYLVRNNAELLTWFNELVVKESLWQDHPEIYHPEVGLGGQLDVFYPNWATPLTLPEECSQEEVVSLVQKHIGKQK